MIISQIFLTINGGSSSIKFAVYDASDPNQRLCSGQIERVGQPGTTITAKGLGDPVDKQPMQGADHADAANELETWLRPRLGGRTITAIGHRVVHGGLHLIDHTIINDKVLEQLKQATAFDPSHLPREIMLIETFGKKFPGIPQVACFDTEFHKDLPTVSKLLPIPRKYFDAGVHRFGFHGLSYAYLMGELRRVAGDAADARVILAHLGSGASMAAVKNGKPIDTTMAFTPTAGLVMGTRPGDLDPGLLVYLLRQEKMSVDQLDAMLNKNCGLLGVSETSNDMRDLVEKRASDHRAKEAVDLFCYQAKKWIGSFAAALGGVDTLVFAGGIGEHSPEARAAICDGLGFLGIEINPAANHDSESVISTGKIAVRVIATDEEIMIARTIFTLVQ